MEIALESAIPTIAGVGVLAAIRFVRLRSSGPIVAVLAPSHGYFKQQRTTPDADRGTGRVEVSALQRCYPRLVNVEAASWISALEIRHSRAGATCSVYLLDSDVPENGHGSRVNAALYGGDSYYRLCQEIVLGIGGLRMLRALGHDAIERFHMNEGTRAC